MDNVDHDLGIKIKMQLNQISSTLSNMPIGQPLVWLYVWDTIRSMYDDCSSDIYTTRPGLELDEVWNELWVNHPGFSLEYGPEALEEQIFEWMINLDYIVDIDTADEE